MNKKGRGSYSWNRNASHHRIAMTRFTFIAFIQSLFSGLLVVLAMGIASDGSREYVVTTCILGLIGVIVTYATFMTVMSVLYAWVLESDRTDPPTPEKTGIVRNYYQTGKDKWELAE